MVQNLASPRYLIPSSLTFTREKGAKKKTQPPPSKVTVIVKGASENDNALTVERPTSKARAPKSQLRTTQGFLMDTYTAGHASTP